ncbi:lycopene cyclase family protein [Belliella aquatica]|uniref:Lycopene cyclase n=1 Tax=Belliella aquatica TaxID=1323734 RepID=A0ABQ1LUV1_9BACT|nr:lycopene cyclase family protein [Belliella aquatica]MCH7405859.1 lycopene cyclase family protein [Belliella aquatica]GGC30161.1 lycopene cyclase [Belliella aquatica]
MNYDIIVSGLGCAGFSFMYYLLDSPLKDKNILIIDASDKKENDRTWCYWASNPLESHPKNTPLVSWKSLFVKDKAPLFNQLNTLNYYHIKSSDFYLEIAEMINNKPNITWVKENITSIVAQDNGSIQVETSSNQTFEGQTLINSIPDLSKLENKKILKQIFLGWKIKSNTDSFAPEHATLMDFSNRNSDTVNFFYVLPYSKTEALIEYTEYSNSEIKNDKMVSELKKYIQVNLGIDDYEITFEESGSIPMSTQNFSRSTQSNWIDVGTVGGCTKPSTGYTFYTVQKHSKMIVEALSSQNKSQNLNWKRSSRFNFYDNILLNIAVKWPNRLPEIFQEMFAKNPTDQILKFLNEETTFWEELKVLSSLSYGIFIKSLLNYERH